MLQPLIVDSDGIAHGVRQGTIINGATPYTGTISWCGSSLREWVRMGGEYRSVTHLEAGYDPTGPVTCLECLSEGP